MNSSNVHELPIKDPVLKVDGLSVYRETQQVVKDISFSLPTGSDTAIVGPNGAGKSTLIQALLGILPHQSGSISFLGQKMSRQGKLTASTRQHVAYLPQNFLCDRRIPITVEEVVGLGWDRGEFQWPWSGKSQRNLAIRQALSQVGAWHLRHNLISGLSGGETKRVLLAYCLVRPRRLLILDEAPAGLDLPSEREFYHLLNQLKAEKGWSILQISHNLDMVRRNCNRVICLNQTIRCQGIPETTLSHENLSATYGLDFVRYHHSC